MELKQFGLVQFTTKQGQVKTAMTGMESLLRLWALQNTKNHRTSVVFDMEDGNITYLVNGTEALPKIKTPPVGKYNVHELLGEDAFNGLFKEAM